MKRVILTVMLSFAVGCGTSHRVKDDHLTEPDTTAKKEETTLSYPKTRRDDVVDELFGTKVADPCRWLEDGDSPEVKKWMAAEDDLARGYLSKLPHRDALADRFAELYYVDSISAPVHRGDRYFYTRRLADKEKRIYYWTQDADGQETVLLDPNTLSDDGSTSVGRLVASWDGKWVAYTLKQNNADASTLHVMKVATGEVSKVDVIPGAKYADPSWTPDSSGFYYTKLPTDDSIPAAELPGYAEVRFHRLGTDPKKDRLVHEKLGDPKLFIGADLSRDGRYLFFYVWHGWNATDVYYKDLKKDDADFQPIVVGKDAQYSIEPYHDTFYVTTNEDAPRWRVMKVDAAHPQRKNWKEIIGQFDDGAVIDNVQVIGGRLVLTLLRNVHADLRVFGLDGKQVRDIELPGIGATFGMTGNPDEDDAYFSFQSFTIPPRIYETSISTGDTKKWAEVKVPIDPSPYDVKQVWYASADGTKVPMFIVMRKDATHDGTTPFLLYGYGGFNVNMQPYFRASIYPWLEAGGGFAVPNIRGGGEFGETWHEQGMRGNKQNVFDDFIAAAEYLVDQGYTSKDRLAIKGASNGGLLVGAVMTQRPDLFRAVVCGVPLLDMVRYHLFGSGKTWIPEYGTAEKEKQFHWLYDYSPYHHVTDGTDYPALLLLSADSDDRVDPMHARKFAAAVQHADPNADTEPVLLRIERNAGHGGADMIKSYVAEDADVYAFLMDQLGLAPK